MRVCRGVLPALAFDDSLDRIDRRFQGTVGLDREGRRRARVAGSAGPGGAASENAAGDRSNPGRAIRGTRWTTGEDYTQGVGISETAALRELDDGGDDPTEEISELIAHVAADPAAYLDGVGGAALTGVVWAARLADYTGDETYRRLFFYAADRFQARGPNEAPSPCDPRFSRGGHVHVRRDAGTGVPDVRGCQVRRPVGAVS